MVSSFSTSIINSMNSEQPEKWCRSADCQTCVESANSVGFWAQIYSYTPLQVLISSQVVKDCTVAIGIQYSFESICGQKILRSVIPCIHV